MVCPVVISDNRGLFEAGVVVVAAELVVGTVVGTV